MDFYFGTITRSGKRAVVSLPSKNQKSRVFMKAFGLIFQSIVVPENPKPIDIKLCEYGHNQWVIGMMWLAKDYFKLWKVTDPPFCEPEIQAFQGFGDTLITLVNLCNLTLDQVPELSTDSPLDFAGKILLEQKKITLTYGHYYQGNMGKTDWGKIGAEGLASLKNWVNPYRPVETPETFKLINAAIGVAKPNNEYKSKQAKKRQNQYHEKAWKPYLNSIRDWNTDIRDGVNLGKGQQFKFGTLQIKGDAIVMPSPKKGGKGWVIICNLYKKNLSGRGRKSNTKIKITLAEQPLQRLESEF
jgi:hypothetical protein